MTSLPVRLGATLCRAAGWGAVVGTFELVRTFPDVRYASWAGQVGLIGIATNALVAAALSVLCFALAQLVATRLKEPRSAERAASTGAGLGLFAVVVLRESPLHAPIAAGALTVLALLFLPPARHPRAITRAIPGALAIGTTLALVFSDHGTSGTIALALAASIAGFVACWRPPSSRVSGTAAVAMTVLALIVLASQETRSAASTQPLNGPNVVLVTFDTTRADYIGCYGKQDAHTPTWDRFASEGILFADATAQANVTGPSHTTMLTGRYPPEHGAVSNGEPLRNDVRAVSELLSSAGWSTGAFVSGFTLDDRMARLAERFDWYDDDLFAWSIPSAATKLWFVDALVHQLERRGADLKRGDRPAGEVVDAALSWIDRQDAKRPFFLWTHFFDAHAPYEPPAPWDALEPSTESAERLNWYHLDTTERRAIVEDQERVRRMLSLYEGEIGYADSQLDRLRTELEARGQAENTLWILTADHGEGFGEHDYWFDHVWLYESELRVPLVMRLPRNQQAGTRIETPVRLVDLAPTIVATCGVEAPSESDGRFDGVDLSPLANGGELQRALAVPAFGRIEGEFGGYELGGLQTSMRKGDWKLIEFTEHWLDSQRVAGRQELYRLDTDPSEQNDLLTDPRASLPPELEELRRGLSFWRDRASSVETRHDHTPEELEALRELGYLGP